MERRWMAVLVAVLFAALAIVAVVVMMPGRGQSPLPVPERNFTLLIYYGGPWSGAISDAAGIVSIGGEDQTGAETQGIKQITIDNPRGYIAINARKGDGSAREMRVILVENGMGTLQDRVTDAPYGIIGFRVPVYA